MDPAPIGATAAASETTISCLANLCVSGFKQCVDSSDDVPEDINDARGRFNVWAANLGALQTPMSLKSLDSRLKDAPLMRKSIISGLERLDNVQQRYIRILTGEQPNRRATVETHECRNMEVNERQELLLNTKACIDHLFGLSILIRRLRPRGKVHAQSQAVTTVPRDLVSITDKFPKSSLTPWLVERLAMATAQRRYFFTYRQEHQGRLGSVSKGKGVAPGEDNVTLGDATTVATTFEEGNDNEASQGRQDDRRSVVTAATSFGSDFDDSGQMGRHIPELSDMILDGVRLGYNERIECPYCRTIQLFTNRLSWKKHVFVDLRPYLCTFENCSVSAFLTRNEWFQHELDNHRRHWQCILCDVRPKFSRKADVEVHFDKLHKGSVTKNQTDLIIEACETTTTKLDASACPLCSEWEPPEQEAIHVREFRRHLARHLQQISLDALPFFIEGLEVQEKHDDEDHDDEDHDDEDHDDEEHDDEGRIQSWNELGIVLSGTYDSSFTNWERNPGKPMSRWRQALYSNLGSAKRVKKT